MVYLWINAVKYNKSGKWQEITRIYKKFYFSFSPFLSICLCLVNLENIHFVINQFWVIWKITNILSVSFEYSVYLVYSVSNLNVKTEGKIKLIAVTYTQQHKWHSAQMKFCITMLCIQRCHAECHVLFIFTFNLVMLSVVAPS